MQNLNMGAFRNQLVENLKELYITARDAERAAIAEHVSSYETMGKPVVEFMETGKVTLPEAELATPQMFIITFEELFDSALKDASTFVEPSDFSVSGKLKKVTLADGFVIQIEAADSRENNERLFDMHQDNGNVIISPAQGYLFAENAEPESTESAEPAVGQLDLGEQEQPEQAA